MRGQLDRNPVDPIEGLADGQAIQNRLDTAADQRFHVNDYEGLASLPGRIEGLLSEDPEAEFVGRESLVVQAHVVRAASNSFKRANGIEEKKRWKAERERSANELRAVIDRHFSDPEAGRPDAQRLLHGAFPTGEGAAADRTLDVVEEVLWAHQEKDVVRALRAERLALQRPTAPP